MGGSAERAKGDAPSRRSAKREAGDFMRKGGECGAGREVFNLVEEGRGETGDEVKFGLIKFDLL